MLMSCGFVWVVSWDAPLASDISDMLSTCRVVFRVWKGEKVKREACCCSKMEAKIIRSGKRVVLHLTN